MYVHDLDPIIVNIGSLALRWYGLAYIGGFILGYFLLKYLSRKNLYPVAEEKMGDFITYAAIFGVLLGGRLGYVLFYQIPNAGWDVLSADPLMVVRVWEGGMASHGGIIGVLLYAVYYARRHQLNWISVLDGLAIVAPIGLFFGRIANFINGELYGRVAPESSSMAMKFPGELHVNSELLGRAMNKIANTVPPEDIAAHLEPLMKRTISQSDWIYARVRDTPSVRDAMGEILPPRYPSQLFEALAEGLLLFLVLWIVRIRYPKAPAGTFCAIFCFLYALGRIVTEAYREPDSPMWLDFTRGQYLSFFIVFMGVGFLIPALKNKRGKDSL